MVPAIVKNKGKVSYYDVHDRMSVLQLWTSLLPPSSGTSSLYTRLFCVYVLPALSLLGFPGGASGKEPACQCRRCKRLNSGLHQWVRNVRWRRAWQPLQYSCLEKSMDRGAWQITVNRVAKSQTRLKCLGTHHILENEPIFPYFSS